jgi:5-methylcytosine-specific restriction protein A
MPSGRWAGSTRAARLPANWATQIVPRILDRDGTICHRCGQPGADAVDHIRPGDDHSDANLGAIHQDVPPYCHRAKSAAEGVAARQRAPRQRPPEPHPGVIA